MEVKCPGATGYVTGREQARILFTSAAETESLAVHEFVHIVSLFVVPSLQITLAGCGSRWLFMNWEDEHN
jgi:hypothetical protein